MRFVADVKKFSDSLKLVSSVVSSTGSGNCYSLVIKKDDLWIYANNETTTVKCKVTGISDLEGKGIAGFDLERFDKILKGRDKILFENKDTIFKFKSIKGSYSGDIVIIPIISETISGYEDTLAFSKKAKVTSLDPNTFLELRNSLAYTGISGIHESDVLDTYIVLDKGTLEVVSSDNFHIAYSRVKCKTDATFSLSPTKTIFEVLGKLSEFYGGTTEIEFSSDSIRARTENYSIVTATLQSSDTAFNRAKKYILDMPKDISNIEINTSKIISILDNILSVYEVGSLVILTLKKIKDKYVLEFSMKSALGNVSDKLPLKEEKCKAFECSFDPRLFLDSINLAKCPEATLSYLTDKALVLKCKKESTNIVYINSVVSK